MSDFAGASLSWKGDALQARIREATRWGIDSVMADCVNTAKTLAPVRYSLLQGSIQMHPAVDEGGKVTGYWGSFAIAYALYMERGTQPHMIMSKGPWSLHNRATGQFFGLAVYHPGTRERPYLMPAAEMHYPSLGLRIRAQLEWGG